MDTIRPVMNPVIVSFEFLFVSSNFFTSFTRCKEGEDEKWKDEIAKIVAELVINHIRKDAYEICLNLNLSLVIIFKSFKRKSCDIFYIRRLFSTPFIFTCNNCGFLQNFDAIRIHFSASSLCRYCILKIAISFYLMNGSRKFWIEMASDGWCILSLLV